MLNIPSRMEFFLGISMDISMNKVSGKCRKADRDIHCAIRGWSAVGNPFAFARYDSLAGIYINNRGSRANLQKAAQDKGVFIEIWSLARLAPARWTNHSRDAESFSSGIQTPDVLGDLLRLISCRHYDSRLSDQICHIVASLFVEISWGEPILL
jgi:hypothetical protein